MHTQVGVAPSVPSDQEQVSSQELQRPLFAGNVVVLH